MHVPSFSPRISSIEMAPHLAPRSGCPSRPTLFVTTDKQTQGMGSDWKNLPGTTHTDKHHCCFNILDCNRQLESCTNISNFIFIHFDAWKDFVHFAFNNKLQIWVSLQSLNCCNAFSFNISGTIWRSHFSLLYLYLFNWKLMKTIVILYLEERLIINTQCWAPSWLWRVTYIFLHILKEIAIPHYSTYCRAKLDIIICWITNLPNLLELNLTIASILFMNLILASFHEYMLMFGKIM
jgi:hypothetical protein